MYRHATCNSKEYMAWHVHVYLSCHALITMFYHPHQVLATRPCSARDNVWLLDHAWTTNYELAKQTLRETDGLVDRLWEMCDMDGKMRKREWQRVKKVRDACGVSCRVVSAWAQRSVVHA